MVAAHNEAHGGRNGVGLVKLMGRDSGFIAAYAALAASEVNFCLIPEAPFTLVGAVPPGQVGISRVPYSDPRRHPV